MHYVKQVPEIPQLFCFILEKEWYFPAKVGDKFATAKYISLVKGFCLGNGRHGEALKTEVSLLWVIYFIFWHQGQHSALSTKLKPLTMWITKTGKFLKRWEYQTTLSVSWETCMQVKKQQLEPEMEQLTGSRWKRVCQGCILSSCLFNFYEDYIM